MTATPDEIYAPRPQTERRLLAPKECCQIGGFSRSTWHRSIRPALPVVRISNRRLGVWDDDFFALLARRTEGGQPSTSKTGAAAGPKAA
jgi:predicted DNA-binding transcriptional regulator AlpA